MSKDAYQIITDSILKSLESDSPAWVRPWSTSSAPHNAVSHKNYNGINRLILGMSEHTSTGWLTYKQAQDAGGQVRKGETGTTVILFKPIKITENNETIKSIPLMRAFSVFNVDQIDNLELKIDVRPAVEFTSNEMADKLLSQATIEHGGDRACFIPSIDKINMPVKTDFKSTSDYYATALHELTHWSGHPSRLDRVKGNKFGDESYAFEELVAELGASFLCSDCSIDGKLQHENYIASWIRVLKSDKKAIFNASSQARKSCEFLNQRSL